MLLGCLAFLFYLLFSVAATCQAVEISYGEIADKHASLAQLRTMACGPDALYIAVKKTGWDVSYAQIRKVITIKGDGCSMRDISEAAKELGIQAQFVTLDPHSIEIGDGALILHTERHFSVLIRAKSGQPVILDGMNSPRKATKELSQQISPSALYIRPPQKSYAPLMAGLVIMATGIACVRTISTRAFVQTTDA